MRKKYVIPMLALALSSQLFSVRSLANTSNFENTSTKVLLGDININGNLDATDALKVLKIAVGEIEITPEFIFYGDMNADNKINAIDSLEILNTVVGKNEYKYINNLEYQDILSYMTVEGNMDYKGQESYQVNSLEELEKILSYDTYKETKLQELKSLDDKFFEENTLFILTTKVYTKNCEEIQINSLLENNENIMISLNDSMKCVTQDKKEQALIKAFAISKQGKMKQIIVNYNTDADYKMSIFKYSGVHHVSNMEPNEGFIEWEASTATIVKTEEELQKFRTNQFNEFEPSTTTTIDDIEKYLREKDEEFFKEKDLLFLSSYKTRSSAEQIVLKDVEIDDTTIEIKLNVQYPKDNTPSAILVADVLAIEIDKDKLNGQDVKITIEYTKQ